MVWTRTGSRLPQGMTPAIIRGSRAAGGLPSFSTLPFVMSDAATIHFGFDPNWFIKFEGTTSTLTDRAGPIVEVPQQFGELEPAQFAVGYSLIWFHDSGDIFDQVFPLEGVFSNASLSSAILVGYIKPPAATRREGIFRCEGYANTDLINPLARAYYEVVYDRP